MGGPSRACVLHGAVAQVNRRRMFYSRLYGEKNFIAYRPNTRALRTTAPSKLAGKRSESLAPGSEIRILFMQSASAAQVKHLKIVVATGTCRPELFTQIVLVKTTLSFFFRVYSTFLPAVRSVIYFAIFMDYSTEY